MILKEIQNKIQTQVPITKLMKIKLKSIENNTLITTAPLDININDKGTGFAGSLSTLVTISAWSVCYLCVKELGFGENNMIAIIKSDTSYKKPVTEDFYCESLLPTKEQLQTLKKKLDEKNSASLKIKSQIIQNNKICVKFEGIYVIKV